MTELADRTAQSRSRLSHQVSRMESRGLVVREGCEGDKRGTFAVLTELGADIIGQVAPHHVASVRRHFIDQLAPTASAPSPTRATGPRPPPQNPRPRLSARFTVQAPLRRTRFAAFAAVRSGLPRLVGLPHGKGANQDLLVRRLQSRRV